MSIAERLNDETTLEENGCWRWKDQKNLLYPYTKHNGTYRTVISHYAEYILGYIPNAVRHTCPNKWCVNPEHLILTGGKIWNARDAIIDGKMIYSITEKEAQQIYDLYMTSGETQADIALAFGIDQTQVSNIVRGRNWAWAIDTSPEQRRAKQQHVFAQRTEKLIDTIKTGDRKTKLTMEQVLEIKTLLKETTLTRKAIGERFSVTPEMISRIAIGKAWAWLK